ncbi:TPA: hypothetical protein N0F65_005551 [Lagenidium giganteum]|uniref:protein disulfide-isomerase n=1 Tax=Lagenidium giganteum TaxID=4803 RepID=A0AAV2YWG0_9STRA|nr:TPA: hypothetical protein N0F65_005551 [Lagenidium giganteum]
MELSLVTLSKWIAMVAFVARSYEFVVSTYERMPDNVLLSEENFEDEVLQSPEFWLVQFCSPWSNDCEAFDREWKAAATTLKDTARLGSVDVTENAALGLQYEIDGYPTVMAFSKYKQEPYEYHGENSYGEIVDFVTKEVKKLHAQSPSVAVVDFQNVHNFLQEGRASTPTAIIIGKGTGSKPPSWMRSLANHFSHGKKKVKATVRLAYVPDNEQKIARQFGLHEDQLPAVVFVHKPSMRFVTSSTLPMDEDSAKAFIEEARSAGTSDELQDVPMFPSPETPRKKPKYSVKTWDASSLRACTDARGRMCVILSASGTNDSTNDHKVLAKRYRRDPITFFVADPDSKPFHALSDVVGDSGEAIIVKPVRKIKYTILDQVKSTNDLVVLLDKVLDGSHTFSVAAMTRKPDQARQPERRQANVEVDEVLELVAMVATWTKSYSLLVLLLVLVLQCAQIANAEYGPKSDVVVLTEKNFEKEVLQSSDYWLVEFYAPWCGHCKQLEPEWKAAAKKLKQHARLGAVDATVHQQLAQKYKIQGYPTIKEFGKNKKKPRDYQGGRSRQDIIQYVKNSDVAKKLGVSGASIATVDFQTVHTLLNDKSATTPIAIFIGSPKNDKKKASAKPPSWMGKVADHFTTKAKKKTTTTVRLAFVPGSEGKIARQFQVQDDQLPAIVFVDSQKGKFQVSDVSPLNEAKSKAFIEAALKADAGAIAELADVPLFPSPEAPKKKPTYTLQGWDAASMRDCTGKSGNMCVVLATFAEDDHRALAKRYRRDPFKFFTADATTEEFQQLKRLAGIWSCCGPQAWAQAQVLGYGTCMNMLVVGAGKSIDDVIAVLDKVLDGSHSFSVAVVDEKHDEL